MGWWSGTILGGDTPLDYLGNLEDLLKCEKLYPLENIKRMEGVRQDIYDFGGLTKLVNAFITETDSYRNIQLQVLGIVLITIGMPIDETLRGLIIEASLDDEWMREEGTSSDRGYHIQRFIDAVREYDGTPVMSNTEGLFEVIGKHIDENKELRIARKKEPVCIYATDQALVTSLWEEGNKLYKAGMVLFTSPKTLVYLQENDPKALEQLMVALGVDD